MGRREKLSRPLLLVIGINFDDEVRKNAFN
jgi:hypothetical protein